MRGYIPVLLAFALLSASGCVGVYKEFMSGFEAKYQSGGLAPEEPSIEPQLAAELGESVVQIRYRGESGYYDYYYGNEFDISGSGVIYAVENDTAYLLTSRRLVDLFFAESEYPKKEKITITTRSNSSFIATERMVAENGVDLAILKFKKGEEALTPAPLSPALPKNGDEVLLLGYLQPEGEGVRTGRVSGLREQDDGYMSGKYTVILTDAAVSGDNAGGGMFTRDGKLVGINALKTSMFDAPRDDYAISVVDFQKYGFQDLGLYTAYDGSEVSAKTAGSGPPASIANLDAYQSYGYTSADDWFDISFDLRNQKGESVVSGGEARLMIIDRAGKSMYSANLSVNDSDFVPLSRLPYYGSMAYTHKAYFRDIAKSESSDYADVFVDFETNGTVLRKNITIYLPTSLIEIYSGTAYDDYGDYYYDDYYADGGPILVPLNGTGTAGGVEVRLLQGGLSTGYYKDYTLLVDIKNAGSRKKEVTINEAVLVTNGRQFVASIYDDERYLGNIYPGAALSHAFYFYDVNKTGNDATLYLDLTSTEDGVENGLNYEIGFRP